MVCKVSTLYSYLYKSGINQYPITTPEITQGRVKKVAHGSPLLDCKQR